MLFEPHLLKDFPDKPFREILYWVWYRNFAGFRRMNELVMISLYVLELPAVCFNKSYHLIG